MPVVSQAQNRYFRAHESDSGRLGKVAREYISASHGMKVSKLPERKKPKDKKKPRPFGALAP